MKIDRWKNIVKATQNDAKTLLRILKNGCDIRAVKLVRMVDIVPNSQEIIGHGSFSIVYKARLKKVSLFFQAKNFLDNAIIH